MIARKELIRPLTMVENETEHTQLCDAETEEPVMMVMLMEHTTLRIKEVLDAEWKRRKKEDENEAD